MRGWVPQDFGFVARPLSSSGARPPGAVAHSPERGLVVRRVPGGSGRLASRNGLWWVLVG
jgi:hypothetical protein